MRAAGGFPPCDVVERMVACYGVTSLAYRHLWETGTLISYIVPELSRRSVLESAVQAYLALKRSTPAMERLLELVQCGEVAGEQREEFERILDDLGALIRPCLELAVFWRDSGKEEQHDESGKKRAGGRGQVLPRHAGEPL